MTDQEQDAVFAAALKDAASDLVKRMIDVAAQSAIAGDADEEILKRARHGLAEFARGAKLLRQALAAEMSGQS